MSTRAPRILNISINGDRDAVSVSIALTGLRGEPVDVAEISPSRALELAEDLVRCARILSEQRS